MLMELVFEVSSFIRKCGGDCKIGTGTRSSECRGRLYEIGLAWSCSVVRHRTRPSDKFGYARLFSVGLGHRSRLAVFELRFCWNYMINDLLKC